MSDSGSAGSVGDAGTKRGQEKRDADLTKDCPYCKESINADAIKCRYCGSMLEESGPAHGGTCPFCKENIKPDALKCRYCGSTLFIGAVSGAFAAMPSAAWAAAGHRAGGFDPTWARGAAPSYNYSGYLHCQYLREMVEEWVIIPGVGRFKYLRWTGNWILDCQIY